MDQNRGGILKGAAHVSAVACDRWADWSLHDHPPLTNGKVTMEIEREVVPVVNNNAKKNGEKMRRTSTLWIYVVEEQGGNREKRRAVREISWVFEDDVAARNNENENEDEEDDSIAAVAGEQRECWVGVYAAKPNKNEGMRKGWKWFLRVWRLKLFEIGNFFNIFLRVGGTGGEGRKWGNFRLKSLYLLCKGFIY